MMGGGDSGQATVELVGLLPLLAAVGLAAYTAVAARAAAEEADHAAHMAAIAALQDRDPRAAARDALPRSAGARAEIALDGRRITVRVRPRVPLLAGRLEATATADPGPEPEG